jgi:uncharacterized membrane protein YhaH (DUF805 family)
MDFVGAIKAGFTNYATFSGVASRAAFWYWRLFILLVSLATTFVPLLGNLASLALLVPDLAVSVRRSRDSGFSAWFLLLWLAPFFALFAILGDLTNVFLNAPFDLETASDEEMATLLPELIPIFTPVFLVFAAVLIFFLITWLMPTKTREQGNKLVK